MTHNVVLFPNHLEQSSLSFINDPDLVLSVSATITVVVHNTAGFSLPFKQCVLLTYEKYPLTTALPSSTTLFTCDICPYSLAIQDSLSITNSTNKCLVLYTSEALLFYYIALRRLSHSSIHLHQVSVSTESSSSLFQSSRTTVFTSPVTVLFLTCNRIHQRHSLLRS